MATKLTFEWIRKVGMEVNPTPFLSWKQAAPPAEWRFFKIMVRKDKQEKYLGNDGLAKLTDEILLRMQEGSRLIEVCMKYFIVAIPRNENFVGVTSQENRQALVPSVLDNWAEGIDI